MKLKVQHTTTFSYDTPVYDTATEIRLQPATAPLASQKCLDFVLVIEPATSIFHYLDTYGNHVHHFNLLPHHDRLQIVATSLVETGLPPSEDSPDEVDEIMLLDYLGESRNVIIDESLREFAAPFSKIGDPYQTAAEVCHQINQTFSYERGYTNARSTSQEVMLMKQGVCQDFAHVMIAVCRSLRLPARYVSGYVYGGIESEGQDVASHAWCEVYVDQQKGWQAFDPTHSTLLVDERYIKIGTGRDYADVPPVRGTYKGRAQEHLEVVVRINRLEN
ncbi:MAG TPA: transglutaminase family protein [Chloroflexia bacterium]|nr:transglutaminase family protein [Chloroflexia bacterium]